MAGLLVTAAQTILPIPYATIRPPVIRADWLIARRPWAITADALSGMLAIATRERLTPSQLAALESQLGQPLANTHVVTVRDGIATIPIEGPIFRRADLFSKISGATDLETLALDLATARRDPAVKGILLHVNSPGGEVDGIHELTGMIRAAADEKPVEAYIAGTGASAAYWLASAAQRITIDATAWAGNIGVLAFIPKPNAEDGYVQFVATRSPRKRPDPTSVEGAAQIQAAIDAVAAVFIADAAANRGMSEDELVAAGDDGWVRVGAAAVEHGLADTVGSYESALSSMAEATQSTDQDQVITIAPVNRAARGPAQAGASVNLGRATVTLDMVPRSAMVAGPGILPPMQGGIMAATANTPLPEAVAGATGTSGEPVMLTAVSAETEDAATLKSQVEALRDERDSANEKLATLQGRIAKMERERLEERAATEVAGHRNDGIPWRGEMKANIARYIKYASAFGEDSDDFKEFRDRERETARAFAESDLLGELGSGGSGPEIGQAEASLNAEARKLMAENPKLRTIDQGLEAAMEANPTLAQQFREETSQRRPVAVVGAVVRR